MTNKETIAYFKEHNEILVSVAKDENVYDYEKQVIEADCMREKFEANEKAIRALEQQFYKECDVEMAEDCISREQAVYVASGYCEPQNIADELRKLPSVQPQPKRGYWEDCSNGWMCSNCYRDVTYELDFCPNCGADMREVKA